MEKLKLWAIRVPVFSVITAIALKASLLVANAATTGGVTDLKGLGLVFCKIIASMFWILIVVATIMIIIAAFQYVLAGDDTEKTTKARKTLTYAAVGIAVALLAWGFPSIVGSLFPSQGGSLLLDSSCTPFG